VAWKWSPSYLHENNGNTGNEVQSQGGNYTVVFKAHKKRRKLKGYDVERVKFTGRPTIASNASVKTSDVCMKSKSSNSLFMGQINNRYQTGFVKATGSCLPRLVQL